MKITKIFIVSALCLLPVRLFAQIKPDKFGTVKLDQLNMKTYNLDNQAEAVVLYDFGNTFFFDADYGFRIIFERTTRVKILSKAGLKFAEIKIPYYIENNQAEEIYEVEGFTYNIENGLVKTTELKTDGIFTEKVNEHWMVKKFAMPDVVEGSVIEYRYKVISPYYFNFRDWEFQNKIPTVYSEYTVKMIPFYEYSYIFQGASKFDVFNNVQSTFKRNFGGIEYPDNIFTFGMKNIPAFRDEQYITSINDYIMKIDFQLAVVHHPSGADVDVITTWPSLITELLKNSNFGDYIKSAAKNSEEILASLNLGTKSISEKAEIITNYVKGTFNWNGYYSMFTDKSVKEFIKVKTGNCAEINLFLCGMLNAAGLQAYPVVLSTRDHGKIPLDYPFAQFLNYVIVSINIDNKQIMMDATESLCPFGMLMARCINDKGLIVNKEKVEWVPLIDEVNSLESDSVTITLNEQLDSALVKIKFTSSGHKAMEQRGMYLSDPESYKKHCIDDDMVPVESVTVRNEREIKQPFITSYNVLMAVETVADKILISPFPGLTMKENPLKVGYRNYPVDMIYPLKKDYHLVLEIPKGYQFVDQQRNLSIDNDLVAISYKAEQVSDKLIIKGTYSFKKAIYKPNEYGRLKGHYASIVETFNERIVLEKINGPNGTL